MTKTGENAVINNELEVESSSILNRTLARLRRVWRDLPGAGGRKSLVGTLHPDLPEADLDPVRAAMTDCIEAASGAVAARAGAADLGRAYLSLNEAGRKGFLAMLGAEFGANPRDVDAAIEAVTGATAGIDRLRAESRLAKALDAPRKILLKQFNSLPQGVKFLVDLRSELRSWKSQDSGHIALEIDLKELLSSWFDVGLLDLTRITWDAPAALLERLIAYEAVHQIRSWSDLKDRLDSDRRFFAFFHPAMPDEPLIFVEVALVVGMADSIQAVLDPSLPASDPAAADSAIFYSISNAQAGLAGISFGNFLIKQVVAELSHEFPGLKTFATLSPIPGFRAWLDQALDAGLESLPIPPESRAILPDLLDQTWADNAEQAEALQVPLMRLAAYYLLDKQSGTRARDPVAHFHLSNGARLERINWLADRSAKGMRESAGLMVNYLYRLAEIETNQSRYAESGTIKSSSGVRNILKT